MNTFTDTQAILAAFFDTLPWPVLIVDERGQITSINREMQRTGATLPVAGMPFAALFPEYCAALSGDVPWLTTQTTTVTRVDHGTTVTERISLHRLPVRDRTTGAHRRPGGRATRAIGGAGVHGRRRLS